MTSSTFCLGGHAHILPLVRSPLRKKRKDPFLTQIAREDSKGSNILERKKARAPHLLRNHLRKIHHIRNPLLKNPSPKSLPKRISQQRAIRKRIFLGKNTSRRRKRGRKLNRHRHRGCRRKDDHTCPLKGDC